MHDLKIFERTHQVIFFSDVLGGKLYFWGPKISLDFSNFLSFQSWWLDLIKHGHWINLKLGVSFRSRSRHIPSVIKVELHLPHLKIWFPQILKKIFWNLESSTRWDQRSTSASLEKFSTPNLLITGEPTFSKYLNFCWRFCLL